MSQSRRPIGVRCFVMKRLGGSANKNVTTNGTVKPASVLILPKPSDGMKNVNAGKMTGGNRMKDSVEDILLFGVGIFVAVTSFILALATGFKLAEFIYGL